MALSPDAFLLIPASVFVAGLIGSPHCVSMCGPIVLNFASSRKALMLYQMGRLVAYTTVGILLGAFGQSVLGTQQSVWVSSLSLLFISALLILNGYRTYNNRPLHFPVPRIMTQASGTAWRAMKLHRLPKSLAAFFAGLLTVLLPCGHLYSFFVGAVATGSAWKGAAFMFAFWLGSAPLLSAGSLWFRKVVSNGPRQAQRVAGVVLVGAGLVSVLMFGARSFEIYRSRSTMSDKISEIEAPRCH